MNEEKRVSIESSADHALRVFVERVVRPVRGEESRKLKMRRELYAHATETYADERQRGKPPGAAADRAIERMGDPVGLTAELQAGVPWPSRSSAWVDSWTRRHPETPRWLHAAWLGLVVGALFLLLMAVTIWPLQRIDPGTVDGRITIRFTLFLAVEFSSMMTIGAWFSSSVRRRLAVSQRTGRSLLGALAVAAAGSMSAFAVGLGVFGAFMAMPGRWDHFLSEIRHAPVDFLFNAFVLSALFAPAAISVAWLDLRERRDIEPWLSLDLE